MSIRSTIILMAVPLFIVLSLVNGALLYFQERAELERGLEDQALSAAVTVAEFLAETDDPRAELAEPVRVRALKSALGKVQGLRDAYLVGPNAPPLALATSGPEWDLSHLKAPPEPSSLGIEGRQGQRWITALAPAGNGRFVAVRISAEPIFDRMDDILRIVLFIMLLSGLFAAALGWLVARRITRELEMNRRLLSGEATLDGAATAGLRIREAQELAEAVMLMEASREAAEVRGRLVMALRDRERTTDSAIAESRSAIFAPHANHLGDTEIALRICGDAPAGSFFAHAGWSDGGAVVLGRCWAPSPLDALATAAELRRLFEGCGSREAFMSALELAQAAYDLEEVQMALWPDSAAAGELRLICVTDEETATRARRYSQGNPGVSPYALLSGLAVMIEPVGVFAALKVGSLADRDERSVDVGCDREDGAEAADVENLAY